MSEKEQCYQYKIGDSFKIELKDNMIYYKRLNGSDFELVKAEATPNSMYGASELKEYATELADKLKLPLKEVSSGSTNNC